MLGRLALLPVLLVTGCSASGGEDDGGGGIGAEVMCEEFVKDRLKSPGSAEFSEQEHADSKYGWRVTGVVDSENEFGALLRADYGCELKYLGDDEWRARKVDVTPR